MMQTQKQPRVLFILGNHNHNTMLHAIAKELPECDRWFTPYYCDDWSFVDFARRLRITEFVALGYEFRRECLDYCHKHDLRVDLEGRRQKYDLVVTCSDLIVPRNVQGTRLVGVQEGMIDPPAFWAKLRRYIPALWRWTASTYETGTSNLYDKYCLASDGYIEDFVRRGAAGHRLVVTGLPNFDNFAQHKKPGHWIEGHVLACTSDGRECLRPDDRPKFIQWAKEIAGNRPLVFKFHPNEVMERSVAEVKALAPRAKYLTDASMGCGEELAANCEALITEWSTLAFFGLAFGKETYSYRNLDEMRPLLPLQNGRAAQNIANVCREVLALGPVTSMRRTGPDLRVTA
jgi:hypothetical protein